MLVRISAAVALSLAFASASVAQDATAPAAASGSAADVRSGRPIFSADGKRLGVISRVDRDAAGTPRSASVIYHEKLVSIPGATLSVSGEGVVTSLPLAEIRKLR